MGEAGWLTAAVMRGGRDRYRGSELAHSRWKVFRVPIASLTAAQTTLPERLATARDMRYREAVPGVTRWGREGVNTS
jgi:hypothetical protein